MNGGGAETLSPGPLGGNLEPVLRPRYLLLAWPSPPWVQNCLPQNSACTTFACTTFACTSPRGCSQEMTVSLST